MRGLMREESRVADADLLAEASRPKLKRLAPGGQTWRGRRLAEGRELAWDSGVLSSQVRFPGPDLEMRVCETIRGGTGQEVWEADTTEDLGGTVCSVASVMSDFL